MDGIGILNNGGGENNAPPLAGWESHQFLQDIRRDLPWKLYRVGLATCAMAVGGLVEQLLAAAASARSSSSGQAEAEDVPPPLSQSQLRLFLLLVSLFGALCAIYAGRRVEPEHAAAATPRWRKAGVVVYFFCLLLLVATVSFVGSGYFELALNLIDDD